MEYFIYVIRSSTSGKIYIGCTNNLVRRLAEHNDQSHGRRSMHTHKNSGPWEIVYQETAAAKYLALMRERQLKSHQGREFVNKLLGR